MTGKSSVLCLDKIFEILKNRDKTKKHIIIAPDRCLFSLEQKLFEKTGESCFFDIDIISLTRLSKKYLSGVSDKKILSKQSGVALVKKLLIENERKRLAGLKQIADIIIDTSKYSIWQLKKNIVKLFSTNDGKTGIKLNIMSFGFKHGVPATCDIVFDVRFLKNPYYVDTLKFKTGNDEDVKSYVLGFDECKEFIQKLKDMLEFLLPLYSNEGKEILEIGIGCTGGKHRSVAIVNELTAIMKEKNYSVFNEHRDILK